MEQAASADFGEPEKRDIAQEFAEYAKAARGTAVKNHTKGDDFGEKLANRRAEIYDRAAVLVREKGPEEAAKEMMEAAKAAHIRTPPLIDFDRAGMQYITARAWQFCALRINPDLPEGAPPWD